MVEHRVSARNMEASGLAEHTKDSFDIKLPDFLTESIENKGFLDLKAATYLRTTPKYYAYEVRQELSSQRVMLRRWVWVSAVHKQNIDVICDRYKKCLAVFGAVKKRRTKRGHIR